VVFVEEPVHHPGAEPSWHRRDEGGVLVCRPHTPIEAPGFHADQVPLLADMVRELADAEDLGRHVAWLYTPLALPVAEAAEPSVVVYDCMDELSLFLGAPPELLQRESELIARADVMFTGGPSLYEAKRTRHPDVHCFSSSVDAAHFRGGGAEPADQAVLARPRLGFYGVIDERIDLAILDRLAIAHPDWQIVMIGPVVKIDPGTLPRHPNIHYLGQRRYEELPAYLAGWDVSLLPFARNDATRFISPTKTLEYMAAEHPIVSTPITDVAGPYGGIVYLGDGPDGFIAACEAALASDPGERSRRAGLMRDVLARTSWDATAAAMDSLITTALRRRAELAVESVEV
jgi:UDP-galactopyranose mutase